MLTIHAAATVLPIVAEPIVDGAVAVEGDRIVAVGPRGDVLAAAPGARVRTWAGVLTPGLVNAHTHLQLTDFADLATSGLPFFEWIRALSARRRSFTDAMWAESARRGVHALLRAGTTSAADVATDRPALAPVARSGLGGISYVEAAGVDEAKWEATDRASVTTSLDTAPAGRAVGLAPHTLYTVSGPVVHEIVSMARSRGLRVHVHLAETTDEVGFVRDGSGPYAAVLRSYGLDMELLHGGSGRTPTAHLDALGGLGPDVHVAHGIHCDAADRALLRARGTAVALCVRSNALLRAGEPPMAAYLAEGSPISLGTDSLASSPSLDLLEEAAAAAVLARRQGYDGSDLARRLVEAATTGGAAAMGRSDIGALRVGARADLAVFDVPPVDPYAALLSHGAGRCVATVLGGRLVHRAPHPA